MAKQVYQFRLTIKAAAWEFGMDAQTLTKKLKSAAILPDKEDGKYSIKQCAEAIYGGSTEALRIAQIEDTKQSSALKKVKRSILSKDNIPAEIVEKVWSDYVVDLRQKINNCSILQKERNDILQDLQTIPMENYFQKVANEEINTDEENS